MGIYDGILQVGGRHTARYYRYFSGRGRTFDRSPDRISAVIAQRKRLLNNAYCVMNSATRKECSMRREFIRYFIGTSFSEVKLSSISMVLRVVVRTPKMRTSRT